MGSPNHIRIIGLLTALLCFSTSLACTFTTVKTRFAAPPPKENPRVIVVGEFRCSYTRSDKDLYYFKKGLLRRLRENEAFSRVETRPETPVPKDGVKLTGVIRLVDGGDSLGRYLIGLGVGEASVYGDFVLRGPKGGIKADFAAWRKYKGGAGIGGADFLCVEDMLALLGETVADVVIDWTKGKPID